MEYYWDSKTLRKDLKTLEDLLKQEQNPVVRERIVEYIGEIKTMIIDEETPLQDTSDETKSSVDNLIEVCKLTPYYELYYPFLEEFKNRLSEFFSQYETKLIREKKETSSLSKEDIIELVHELFKSTNKEFYEAYSRLYKERKTHIRFKEAKTKALAQDPCIGGTIFLPGLNKPYVHVDNFNPTKRKTDALLTLTHEEGHAVASLLNTDRYFSNHSFFKEIESTFFELLGNDFYGKILNDKSFARTALGYLEGSYYEAYHAVNKKLLADKLFAMGIPLDENIRIKDKALETIYMDVLEDDGLSQDNIVENEIKYSFSHLVAIELFELYKEDKDLALHLLKTIIERGKEESEYKSITSVITPGKSLIKYKDGLIKRIKK
ncbi:MAG: hypothetical protein J6A52_07305 [Bacilli bacterium]|nr:hypothetical protein [Bacilli bacterium]